ncbi:MerR family transcriptional regulator [Devosia algicola]|uniref:MerR family transcriptional regulator n=1 Tax=Devosia algicola TaxID=3026418 RepID=A0ABY7YK98_9HYPH|nr:MerR family transcriptional regulator [Devosia algicola]WDR01681.1 MerR family transcriptional regulator [Devosia algicola]
MRIGEIAQKTGLSRDAIRFYERRGLLRSQPSTDKTNSYRRYGDEMIEQIETIKLARDAGLSLADLEVLLGVMGRGGRHSSNAQEFLQSRIGQVRGTIANSVRLLVLLCSVRDGKPPAAN